MAALVASPTLPAERASTPASNSSAVAPPSRPINTTQWGTPAPVPNKHIPYCSPGPKASSQQRQLETPPASPPSPSSILECSSITHPPHNFDLACHDPPVYSISGARLAEAIEHFASQPLPAPSQVFPWMHGLHADNHLQLAFFIARKKSLRRTPRCIRGLTIVKAGGDLTHSKLKGAIAPDEILQPPSTGRERRRDQSPAFLEVDPKDGFCVRNFQIQACKLAAVSDIVVYGDEHTSKDEVKELAKRIAKAQSAWQRKMEPSHSGNRPFNTFILSDDYQTVESMQSDIVALDSEGCLTGKVVDFFHWERVEMATMTRPSEIAHNVWLGPTPDPSIGLESDAFGGDDCPLDFDLLIECSDIAQMPEARSFETMEEALDRGNDSLLADHVLQFEFPGSGTIMPPTWSHEEVDGLISTCEWIYKQANRIPSGRKRRDSKLSLSPELDADGDSAMHDSQNEGRKILIHCVDGYTESSLLALAYYMYTECVPAHQAWLQLHLDKRRNFFAYSSDAHLLRVIQPRLLQASPKYARGITQLAPPVPSWMDKVDGSLPSRIMPYMYLGNLGHANNPELLRALNIGQILSVGEPISWTRETLDSWRKEDFMYVDRVQDNGVDPLTDEFGRCLEFIENGRRNGTATLVHCRVGVSRSATICIAEVMNELGLSLPRAYCFVRARRLNVIIQPHLRFSYELLKWEEFQCQKRGKPLRRELEWATISREIAALNKPYSRQS